MATIRASFLTDKFDPLVSPTDLPTIRIRRTDTQALVITDANTIEQGDGNYTYDFVPDDALQYVIRVDGDPLGTGQTATGGRYAYGSLSGSANNEIATAVLDALLSGHFTPDSVGEALTLIRGLTQQNYMVDSTVFNPAGLMLSARFRLFPSSASLAVATDEGVGQGELASFTVTVEEEPLAPAALKTYKVSRD